MKHAGPLWEDFEYLEKRVLKIEIELSKTRNPSPSVASLPPPPAWLNLEQRLIEIPGQMPKRLTEKEYRFIESLSRRGGNWVTSEDIIRHVWEYRPAMTDPNHSVRTLAWTVRKTIACTGYVVENSYGGNYRLRNGSIIPETERRPQGPASALDREDRLQDDAGLGSARGS